MPSPVPTPTDVNQWIFFMLGGYVSPGFIPRTGGIKGFSRETGWDEKKGKGTQGATVTLTSAPPAKGTVTLHLIGPGGFYYWGGPSTDFAQWDSFVTNALSISPAKQQSEGLTVWHPALAAVGITSVVVKGYSPLEHIGKGLYQATIELIEWQKPPPVSVVSTVSGTKTDSSGADTQPPPLDPQTIANKIQIQALQAAIAAANAAKK